MANLRRGKEADKSPIKQILSPKDRRTHLSPSPRNAPSTISTGRAEVENRRRARTLPTTTVSNTTTSTKTRITSTTNTKSPSGLAAPQTHLSPQTRLRPSPSGSRTSSDVTSAHRPAPVPSIPASRPLSSASRPGSSISRTSGSKRGPTPVSSAKIVDSRTPTPDLPDPCKEPTTPLPKQKQKKTMQALGLGTPELDRWIRTGQEGKKKEKSRFGNGNIEGKAKAVGFKESNGESDTNEHDHVEPEKERSLIISPRRPSVNVSGIPPQSWAAASPALNSSQKIEGGPGSSSSAHELLKTIVQDVMYDFQRDTKADMMGLHLDLVRMGRGWKAELRSLMDEYVGDLKDLREENQKLRLENERLRRGTY